MSRSRNNGETLEDESWTLQSLHSASFHVVLYYFTLMFVVQRHVQLRRTQCSGRGIAYYESKTYYKCVSVFKLHHTDALLDWKSSMNSLEINPRGLWLNDPNTLFNQHKKQTRFNLICAQLLVIWFYAHSVWKSGDSFYTNVRLLNFSCSQVVLTCSLLLYNIYCSLFCYNAIFLGWQAVSSLWRSVRMSLGICPGVSSKFWRLVGSFKSR